MVSNGCTNTSIMKLKKCTFVMLQVNLSFYVFDWDGTNVVDDDFLGTTNLTLSMVSRCRGKIEQKVTESVCLCKNGRKTEIYPYTLTETHAKTRAQLFKASLA